MVGPTHGRTGEAQLHRRVNRAVKEMMMKRVLLLVVLGSLALASAGQDQTGSSVEVRGSAITIPAHA